MKTNRKLSLILVGAVAMLAPNMFCAPAAQAHGISREMKAELRFEHKLAGNQFYNVNAPYLEPAFAPAPGVVNEVMRIF